MRLNESRRSWSETRTHNLLNITWISSGHFFSRFTFVPEHLSLLNIHIFTPHFQTQTAQEFVILQSKHESLAMLPFSEPCGVKLQRRSKSPTHIALASLPPSLPLSVPYCVPRFLLTAATDLRIQGNSAASALADPPPSLLGFSFACHCSNVELLMG